MSEDILVALERALELVGEGVWSKLSDTTRANILLEELNILDRERVEQRSEERS